MNEKMMIEEGKSMVGSFIVGAVESSSRGMGYGVINFKELGRAFAH
jgi:hypothetical protein